MELNPWKIALVFIIGASEDSRLDYTIGTTIKIVHCTTHVYIRICVTRANVDKHYAINSNCAGSHPVII